MAQICDLCLTPRTYYSSQVTSSSPAGGNFYFFCSNIKDYFFSAINNLSTTGLPQYKIDKVQRAKDIVAKVKKYEIDNLPDTAELEVKKLIPAL
jgi:hypothetical protein